jgi:protein SCO1
MSARSLSSAVAFLVGVAMAMGMAYAHDRSNLDPAAGAATIPGLPGLGGPFSLIDQVGNRRTDEEFRGRLLLVTFGYSNCPDVCPLDLQKVTEALRLAGPEVAAGTVPLFITVDPDRDTPQRLKEFVGQFSPDIVGLSGTREAIARVAEEYHMHIAFSRSGEPSHSDFQYLMGRDGKLLSLIVPNATAEDIAARLRKYAANGQG